MTPKKYKPLLVGIGHRKRVGKDTAAKMLERMLDERGVTAYRHSFAEELKGACYSLFSPWGLQTLGYYEENPECRTKKLEGINKTPRDIWVEVGIAMRNIHQDVWLEAVLHCIPHPDARPIVVIIPDVRFPNEVAAIQQRGGLLARLDRPSVPDTDDAADCALGDFTGWDIGITNSGSLDRLRKQVELLVLPEVLRKADKHV